LCSDFFPTAPGRFFLGGGRTNKGLPRSAAVNSLEQSIAQATILEYPNLTMISTILVIGGVAVVSASLLGGGAAALYVYIRKNLAPRSTEGRAPEPLLVEHGMRISELEITVKGLPSLWEEERKRAKRAADAARKARESADQKLDEIEALIEESADIPGINAAGGPEPEMQRVRPNMGVPADPGLQDRAAAVAHLLR